MTTINDKLTTWKEEEREKHGEIGIGATREETREYYGAVDDGAGLVAAAGEELTMVQRPQGLEQQQTPPFQTNPHH